MAKRLKDSKEIEKIRATIIDKLDRSSKWGPIHTGKENAVKGIPSHELGAAKEVIEAAIKDGFLNWKPTSYEDQNSLNFKKKEEIMAIIRDLLP
jgi:hypothetical protein